jgi:hypothetical protein
MGDVTVYRVETPGGTRIEALLANSQSGRAKFFEVRDAVRCWSVDAGQLSRVASARLPTCFRSALRILPYLPLPTKQY